MQTTDSAALEDAAHDSTELDDRDVRALTEVHSVLDDVGRVRDAPDLYLVVSGSGSEYMVDLRTESCECADARHRDVTCKHIRRAQFATGQREIPAWVDTDALDGQLGEHVSGARVAATDGGVDAVVGESTTDTEDTEECDECADLPAGWPCARCFVAGEAEFTDEEGDR